MTSNKILATLIKLYHIRNKPSRCGDYLSTSNWSTDILSTPTTRRQLNSRHFVDLILSTDNSSTFLFSLACRGPMFHSICLLLFYSDKLVLMPRTSHVLLSDIFYLKVKTKNFFQKHKTRWRLKFVCWRCHFQLTFLIDLQSCPLKLFLP